MDTLSNISDARYQLPLSEADQTGQAAIGRETAPWTFHVVGPDGIREVTEHEASQDTAG